MNLWTPFVAVILSSLFFLGIWGFYDGIAEEYEKAGIITIGEAVDINNGTTNLEAVFDKSNSLNNISTQIQNKFDNIKGPIDAVGTFVSITYDTSILLYRNLLLIKDVFGATIQVLGLPPVVATTFFLIILLIFVLTVILVLAGRIV